MAKTDVIWRYAVRLTCLALFLLLAGQAFAAACGGSGQQAARLQRQIAANVSFQVRHGCDTAGAGFVCREIAERISTAHDTLAALSPSCDRPRAGPVRGETAGMPKRTTVRTTEPKRLVVPAVAAKIETMCVRLSDGYYFPTPNSGFRTTGSVEAMTAQCRSICDDPGMDVFRRNAGSGLSEDMVSLASGTRYEDLPNAGAYRRAKIARICDMARFYRSFMQDAAGMNGAETVPQTETVVAALLPAARAPLFSDVNLRGSTSVVPDAPRRVRRVGPAYLPDE